MKYGLIGFKLGHSFSAQIHKALSGLDYELIELNKDEVQAFFEAKSFSAVNVTIPYKTEVMRFLDYIDPVAQKIGAVNTVVNKNGKLYGYNTDYLGLKALIEKNQVSLENKTVLICGTGGTSLTARQLAKDLGAKQVLRLSRTPGEDSIGYTQACEKYADAQIIINTTPAGMYPNLRTQAINISAFSELEAVFDVVYNPLNTELILSAEERGITAEGGLYMLVAQAIYASEYFLDTKYESETFGAIYASILQQRKNIVLIGMPGSGKSTVGRLLAERLGKELADTDELIVKNAGMEITEIFERFGQAHFRALEAEVIETLSRTAGGKVIATGGGAVLNAENVKNLRRNGKIYFLNRRLEDIVPTADRPLALDTEAVKKRYEERYALYLAAAHRQIKIGDSDARTVAEIIRKDFISED